MCMKFKGAQLPCTSRSSEHVQEGGAGSGVRPVLYAGSLTQAAHTTTEPLKPVATVMKSASLNYI